MMEPRCRDDGSARRMASNRLPRTTMVIEIERGLQVHVEFISRLPDEQEDRRVFPTGNVLSDVLARTRTTPLNSKFLVQAMVQLQAAFTDWFQLEKLVYADYLRAELGPTVRFSKSPGEPLVFFWKIQPMGWHLKSIEPATAVVYISY